MAPHGRLQAVKSPMPPDHIPLDRIRRVLVVKLRHHGDVLLTSPLLATLKQHAPHAEIDALVYADTAPMLAGHPALSQLHTTQRSSKSLGAELTLFRQLRQRQYDLLIHLTDSSRGAWLARLLRVKWAVCGAYGGKPKFWRKSFTHLYPVIGGNRRHTVEIHLDALRRIGIFPTQEQRKLVLQPSVAARDSVRQLLQQHGIAAKRFVQIHPASRWLFKCWPAERMAELIRNLQQQGHTVVLTGAPDARERDLIDRIKAAVPQAPLDLGGQLDLQQLAALTAAASLFIGMDSVPMHIAAAMQTPTVALFGPSGDIEWGPWQVPHRIVTSNHPCRPCGKDGCGGSKRSECLELIPVQQVLQAIAELQA